MQNDHTELIRCLRILCSDYSEWLDRQVMLRSEAEALIQESHVSALRTIGIKLAPTDPVACDFVQRTNASITEPYQFSDTLTAARRLAPSYLRRLERERDAEQAEARQDPVTHAQRQYIRERAEFDPFMQDGNVMVSGLALPDKPRVKIDSLGGVVEED